MLLGVLRDVGSYRLMPRFWKDEHTLLTCLFVPAIQDVDEALKRLPQEEVDARNQRLKRAMDLSLKHVDLEKDMQAKQTPYLSYIRVCSSFLKTPDSKR